MDSMELSDLNKPVVRIDTPENAYGWDIKPNAGKISPNIQILSIDEYKDIEASKKYMLPSRVAVGDIIVEHPFHPNQFVKIQDIELTYYQDWMELMSDIARLLGCVKFEWSVELKDRQDRTLDANLNVGASAYGSLNASEKTKYENELKTQLKDSISNTPIKKLSQKGIIKDYEKAKKRVREYGLENDIQLRTLINSRSPEDQYRTSKKEVELEISRDINDYGDYAFSLNVLGDVFTMSADLKEAVSKRKKVHLIFKMMFDNNM